jgi:hypothetical protein
MGCMQKELKKKNDELRKAANTIENMKEEVSKG